MVAVKRRRGVHLLNAGNQEGYSFLETPVTVARTGSGYVIVTRPSGGSSEKEGGFLAKRAAKSAMELAETGVKRAAKAVARKYMPIEDDPMAGASVPEDAVEEQVAEPAK